MACDGARSTVCRVVLVEDHAPVRERLAAIIRNWPGGQLIAACSTLAAGILAIKNYPIDILITDLNLPDGHGVQAIRTLRNDQPAAEAIVISVLADDVTVIEAIEAGATGYLLKDSDAIDVIEVIAELLAGRSPISSAIARTIVRRVKSQVPAARPISSDSLAPSLSPREMEILSGLAKGLTYSEIADRLEISKQTVPLNIKNIYRKLQANNRSPRRRA